MQETNKRISFVFVIPFHHNGGVERWLKNIVTELRSRGFAVLVFCHGKITESMQYMEDIGVEFIVTKRWPFVRFVQMINTMSVYSQPIVISALTPSNLFCAINRLHCGFVFIPTVHLSLKKTGDESIFHYMIKKYLHRYFYSCCSLLVVVSKGIRTDLESMGISGRKIFCIYNPVLNRKNLRDFTTIRFDDKELVLTGCGRLEKQKGFERLIQAFAEVVKAYPRYTLHIVGTGSQEDMLKFLCAKKGISENVVFDGYVQDPFEVYKKSKIFVLTSYYEGFGNVLAEALSAKCLCISFDIPHGPREILMDGTFGFLVPDGHIDRLSDSIQKAIVQENFPFNEDELLNHLKTFTSENFVDVLLSKLDELLSVKGDQKRSVPR